MMPLQQYPSTIDNTLSSVADAVRKIAQIRQNDQTQWNNLQNQFIAGRKVAKVPASSTDIAGNVAGDFNFTSSYAYFCVASGSTVQWVRTALGTF